MKEPLVYVDRQNTNSVKWDALPQVFDAEGLIPLWVADMDFKCPEASRTALARWVETGAFGYYKIPESYHDAFISWQRERHGYAVERDWLRFAPGIVTAVYWLVRLLSRPGDNVAVLTPVYYPFFSAIEGTGRKIVRSELVNAGGVYTIDYADFENKIANGGASVFIMCSPHNPVGRVWRREEVQRLCDICKKHSVAIISDEIHQDLITGGHPHTPTALCGDNIVTVASGSKTFNLAGLHNSFIIIPDAGVRERFDKMASEINITSGGAAGYIATQAAFESGHGWLESLLEQVRMNYEVIRGLAADIDGAVLSPLEGTYLAWLDLGACCGADKIKKIVQDECGLAVDYGDWFGGEKYTGFIRINLATSGENIREAARRLKAALA